MTITLWSSPVPVFTTSTGTITGLHWGRTLFSQTNDPVAIDTATPSATYDANGLNDYTVYLTAQNWEGDEQPSIAVAQTGDISLPFTFARGTIFSGTAGVANDAVMWWSASATVGAYDINFETYTDDTSAVYGTTPALSLSGHVVTLESGITDPTGWTYANNASNLVLVYGTQSSSTTKDLHLQVFDASGHALTQSSVVETVPLTTADSIFYSAKTGSFTLVQTTTVNGAPGMEFSPIDLSTGTIGTPVFQAFPKPAATGSDPITIDGYQLVQLANGNILEFVNWQDPTADIFGLQGISTRLLNSNFVDITDTTPSFTSRMVDDIAPGDAAHFSVATLSSGASVLVWAADGGVFMMEFDANGNQEGSIYGLLPPMPAGSSTLFPLDFDSVVALGSRIEITFKAEDPTTGLPTDYSVIYDTATGGYSYTINDALSPSGQWVGTPYNDVVTYGAGVNEVNGGGGTDTFIATTFTASQVSVVVDAKGNVVFSDGKGDVDTLERFTTIDLSDATITINGNVLTQQNADGSSTVSTFNIAGEPYASDVKDYDTHGTLLEAIYYRTDGSIYETDVACYCPGTLIATALGDVPVEELKIGDLLLTLSGEMRPIQWIGRRSYSGRFAKGQKHLLPICITAGALDAATPRRDLWISPHHAMFIDGVLIEAKDLVNDMSIFQADMSDGDIDYIHIELEEHAVILADGAWSETFLDDGSRGMFHNSHEFGALHPEPVSRERRYCAPRLDDGFALDAVRRRLARRAMALGNGSCRRDAT